MTRGAKWMLVGGAAVCAVVAYELWYPHGEADEARLRREAERRNWIEACIAQAVEEAGPEEYDRDAERRLCTAHYDDLVSH